ncbi:MAG TPA: hypothetical protein VGA84_07045 [Thermoanaerobaculia bacterium]
MNEHRFTAEVARHARDAGAAKELWSSATSSLQERAYTTPKGIVRVRAGWGPLASEEDVVRIDVTVIDDSGHLAPRDVPSFVELFFYDAFLLFNIAVPGSFSAAITVSGGEFRVNELTFDAAPFAAGVSTVVPLNEVVAWYRGGTEQIAATPMQTVLFHLLHIAGGGADEWTLRARLDACLKELGISEPSLDVAGAAVIHPMHDEALDERLDDGTMESIDRAMVRVLTAVQQAVRE